MRLVRTTIWIALGVLIVSPSFVTTVLVTNNPYIYSTSSKPFGLSLSDWSGTLAKMDGFCAKSG